MKQKLGALDRARIRVTLRKLFFRCRAPLEVKVEAVLAYYYGLSFRAVARMTGYCAETIRLWWLRLATAFSQIRGQHGIIVADETSIHAGKHHRTVLAYRKKGRQSHVTYRYETRRVPASHLAWVAIEAKTMRVIHIHLSQRTTNVDCNKFLVETRARTRPSLFLLHDRGPWYRSQPKALGIHHQIVKGGYRSRIECWNRQLKHRLDRFWRAFPPNSTPNTMQNWLKSYAVVWNATRH